MNCASCSLLPMVGGKKKKTTIHTNKCTCKNKKDSCDKKVRKEKNKKKEK